MQIMSMSYTISVEFYILSDFHCWCVFHDLRFNFDIDTARLYLSFISSVGTSELMSRKLSSRVTQLLKIYNIILLLLPRLSRTL